MANQQKKPDPVTAIFKLILLGVFITAWLSMCVFDKSDNSKSSSGRNSDKANNTDAFVLAENFVKASLKAPSTADFGSVFETADAIQTVSFSGNTFTVNWHVDAQNSYGAKLRSYYTCRLTYNGGDINSTNNWTCNYLKIDGNVIIGN